MYKNLIKQYLPPFLLALVIALFLNIFIIAPTRVKNPTFTKYNINDRLLINKMTKNFHVGDIIKFKINNQYYVRQITDIDNNNYIVPDTDNSTITINKDNIIGKVICKVF